MTSHSAQALIAESFTLTSGHAIAQCCSLINEVILIDKQKQRTRQSCDERTQYPLNDGTVKDTARNTTPLRYGESVRKAKGGRSGRRRFIVADAPANHVLWAQLLRTEGYTSPLLKFRCQEPTTVHKAERTFR
jgi:hypothetical protein